MKPDTGKGKKLEINLEPEMDKPHSGFKVTLQKRAKIKTHLDAHVIGQEGAKKSIAVAVYNHYKRISNLNSGDVELEKSNNLLYSVEPLSLPPRIKITFFLNDFTAAIVDSIFVALESL